MSIELEMTPKSEAFYEVYNRVNKASPSKQELKELRAVFEQHPEVWRETGDLCRMTSTFVVENIKGSKAVKQSIRYTMKAMRDEMNYNGASPLEQLLIEQVILGWLGYYVTHWNFESISSNNAPMRMVEHWEKRLNGAQRRYLRAIDSLNKIRKAGNRIQINIAEQQTNIN